VILRIGDPIPTDQATIRDRLQLTELLRERIIKLIEQNLPTSD
jgi:hypothetical protein